MAAIVKELSVKAQPATVYGALTQQDKIAQWWTDDLNTKPEVGSLAEFRFRDGHFVLEFEIAGLDTNKKVFWIAKKGQGFEGTTITWTLSPAQNGTMVSFNQDGFPQMDEGYALVRGIWEYFLASFQSYLETGKGTPGFPAHFG